MKHLSVPLYLMLGLIIISCSTENDQASNRSGKGQLSETNPTELTQMAQQPEKSDKLSKDSSDSDVIPGAAQSKEEGVVSERLSKREARKLLKDFEGLREELTSKEERFVVSADEEIEIVGELGTRIYIPKEGLVYRNGKTVTGKVNIHLIECYDNASFFAHRLNTKTTSDELLETGGMIRVIALQDGDTLSSTPMQPMTVCFPKKGTDKPGMQSFLGEENVEGRTDWVRDPLDSPADLEASYRTMKMDWKDLSSGRGEITKTFQLGMVRPKTDEADEKIVWNFEDSVGTLDDWLTKQIWKRRWSVLSSQEKEFTMKVSLTLTESGAIQSVTSTHLVDPQALEELHLVFRNAPLINMHGKRANVKYAIYLNGKQISETNPIADKFKKEKGGDGTKLGRLRDAELKYYIVQVSQLGWINCDRFYDDKRERVALNVAGDENTEVYVVFTKVKSQMGHLIKSGGTRFDNLPLGEPIKIVAMKKQDDEILLSVNETVVGKEWIQVAPNAAATLEDVERAFATN